MGCCLHQMGIRITFGILIALTLGSCVFDDDSEYQARTKATFFLIEDTSGNGLQIVKFEGGVFEYNWGQTVTSGAATEIVDAYLFESTLWLASQNEPRVFGIDLREEQLDIELFPTFDQTGQVPSFVVAHDDRLLAGFSNDSSLMFIDRTKSGASGHGLDVGVPFRGGIYNGGKYYLQSGEHDIYIYSDVGEALINKLTVQDTIIQFFLTIRKDVWIYAKNGSVYSQSRIDANADEFESHNEPSPVVDRALHTPYSVQTYGSEYLSDILTFNGAFVTPQITDSVSHFEVDFFEGKLFYQWQDSLTTYDLNADTIIQRDYFPYKIRKGFHYVDVL